MTFAAIDAVGDLLAPGALVALGALVGIVPQRLAASDRRRELKDERAAAAEHAAGAAQASMICELQVAVKRAMGGAIAIMYHPQSERAPADAELIEAVSVIELAKGRVADPQLLRLASEVSLAVVAAPGARSDGASRVTGELLDAGKAFSDRVREVLRDLPPPDPPRSLFEGA